MDQAQKKNALKEVLNSEEIKPLFERWSDAHETIYKVAGNILRPMTYIAVAGLILAGSSGMKGYNQYKELKENSGMIELRETVARKELQGYLSDGLDYQSKIAFGAGATIGALVLSMLAVGSAHLRSRKKYGELEKALNDRGLSMDDLKDGI